MLDAPWKRAMFPGNKRSDYSRGTKHSVDSPFSSKTENFSRSHAIVGPFQECGCSVAPKNVVFSLRKGAYTNITSFFNVDTHRRIFLCKVFFSRTKFWVEENKFMNEEKVCFVTQKEFFLLLTAKLISVSIHLQLKHSHYKVTKKEHDSVDFSCFKNGMISYQISKHKANKIKRSFLVSQRIEGKEEKPIFSHYQTNHIHNTHSYTSSWQTKNQLLKHFKHFILTFFSSWSNCAYLCTGHISCGGGT